MIKTMETDGFCTVDFNLDTGKVMEELRQAKEMDYRYAKIALSDEDKAKANKAWEAYWGIIKKRSPYDLIGILEAMKEEHDILMAGFFSEYGGSQWISLGGEIDEHKLLDELRETYLTLFAIPVAILTNYDKIMAYKGDQ